MNNNSADNLFLKKSRLNRRQKTIFYILFCIILLSIILICGQFITEDHMPVNFIEKGLKPSKEHIFGTDWFGRDMFVRTIKGLSLSIIIGIIASVSSGIIAIILGVASAVCGKRVDAFVGWLTDVFMGMPHLIFLLLISFVAGKGPKGIIIGIVLTHWTYISRIIRAEVLQIRSSQYVIASKGFGKSNWYIAKNHIIPHIFPQFFVGLILMFPHAILHEASLTFLGFGLSPHQPGIGVILSESLNYLSIGQWWTALMPGLSLLLIVRLFDILGENIQSLYNPNKAHE
ncbi:peptide/nickel transport system permease protein [Tissierella praeacuta DSM 18095]|uniref:Peptide/nickel transport system permease protein n=1 Tax=Tissierella praeacuta DSM 18095 TaxID=1123404 RepID=A0A1M4YHA3_9FIRM|nr:ABC transporter permease [Tissierella praeacuta]TCU66418.1 peptide/nickel transport system permease protein [Tissierella praeacuta]SHF05175.1 peptide/nickel transport system permease protein [Tissierella praeacuta DSM 18095]SUP02017.1 Probable D,D-dipeptide transport system permease protein ddpC [Tissierella praeacuta]